MPYYDFLIYLEIKIISKKDIFKKGAYFIMKHILIIIIEIFPTLR